MTICYRPNGVPVLNIVLKTNYVKVQKLRSTEVQRDVVWRIFDLFVAEESFK